MDSDVFLLADEHRKALLELKTSTGIGATALLRGAADRPPGLSASTINLWLDGHAQTARRDHYAYVLARWRAASPRLPLTPAVVDELRAERDRTGVGAIALLNGRADIPTGLSAGKLQQWLNGKVKTAPADHIEYVRRCWAALPSDEWVTLDEKIIDELRSRYHSTAVASRLHAIMSSGTKVVRASHLRFMLGQ